MSTHTVNLTERDEQFISQQIAAGEFENSADVLRAGLRLLKHQTHVELQQVELLKQLAKSGFDALDQGQGLTLEDEQQLTAAIARIGQRAADSTISQSEN